MSEEITVTQPTEAVGAIAKLEQWAAALTVATPDQRTEAATTVAGCARWRKQVVAWFADSKTKAHAAWKAIVAQEATLTDRLEAVERRAKAMVLAYDAEQDRIRRAEQSRLQAVADADARKERERLEREAAKLKTPELRQERMEQAQAVVPVAVCVAAPEKTAGEVTSTVWRAELIDMAALVKAAGDGHGLAARFLVFDQAAANKAATANKDAVPVPGVRFFSQKQMAFR